MITMPRPDGVCTASPVDSPSLRVMMLLGGLSVGGAETQAIALASELMRTGHTVTLLAMGDEPLRAVAESHGLAARVLPRRAGGSLTSLPTLVQQIRHFRPTILYAFLEVQWLWALAAAAQLRVADRPYVVLGLRTSQYDVAPTQPKAQLVRWLTRHAAPRADLLIANSRHGLDSFYRYVPKAPPGAVVYNGIDVGRFSASPSSRAHFRQQWLMPPEAWVIGHVGRLDPVKDHEMLLRAFQLVSAADVSAHLVCIGHGDPDRVAALEALASQYGISSRVHFAGGHVDVSGMYPAIDVLSLSSRREGFPNVVAEAMSCGVPAIVTDSGASAEIVGPFGEVAPVGDADAFARGIIRLRRRCSAALSLDCRLRIASQFSLETTAANTVSVLQSLLLPSSV